jgi:hypothetical protein
MTQLAYHQVADVANVDNQTGLASGSALMRAHQEIALGLCGLTGPTLLQVALWGSWGVFSAVNEQCVVMTLTWTWLSLEGSILAGRIELATHLKKSSRFQSNSSVGGGLNSKCPRPTPMTLLNASWIFALEKEKNDVCSLIIEILCL